MCHICDRAFFDRGGLQDHIDAIHEGEYHRPFRVDKFLK